MWAQWSFSKRTGRFTGLTVELRVPPVCLTVQDTQTGGSLPPVYGHQLNITAHVSLHVSARFRADGRWLQGSDTCRLHGAVWCVAYKPERRTHKLGPCRVYGGRSAGGHVPAIYYRNTHTRTDPAQHVSAELAG